jgi:hypothetical protein
VKFDESLAARIDELLDPVAERDPHKVEPFKERP